MNGQVVRAVSGRRDEYRPVVSTLTTSTDPTEVAQALLAVTGANELYVADLDAIRHNTEFSRGTQRLLEQVKVPVWVDAGIGRTDVLDFPDAPNLRPVVGFETCRVPEVLLETVIEPLRRPVAFSLDLKDGRLHGNWAAWGLKNDLAVSRLARRVYGLNVRTLIVLDLARVGTGTGTGTEPLLRELRAEFPDLELIAGGGVRSWEDIARLGEAGADGVLVASALHDGTLTVSRR
jgi:HisA/HisF family protein